MGRTVRSVALGLSLLSSLLVGVANAAHAQAPIGTEVPYVDADGVARGTVLIKELGDPFTGNDPDRPAPDGQRYIGLSVAFTAADDQTFNANPSYIILRATDGHLYQPAYVPRLPDDLSPDLQAQTLAPGNRVSGFIGYTVPADAVIDEVTCTSTTPIGLSLWRTWCRRAGPAAGTPVDYLADDGTPGTVHGHGGGSLRGFRSGLSGAGGLALRRPGHRGDGPRRGPIPGHAQPLLPSGCHRQPVLPGERLPP